MQLFLTQFIGGAGCLLAVVGGILIVAVGCGLMAVMAVKFYRWFMVYMNQELAKAKDTTKEVVECKSVSS